MRSVLGNCLWSWVLALCLALLAGCSAQSAEEHLENARAYTASGEFDAAVIELKNALRQDLNLVDARAMLADLQFSSGDYRAAEADYKRALAGLVSEDPRFKSLKASLWLCQIRLQQAAGVISELTELEGSAAEKRLPPAERSLLGLARLALDDSELAQREFLSAIAEDSEQYLAHYGLARVAWLAGDSAVARERFARAVGLETRDPELLLSKAEFELTQGDFDSARATYALARALPGNDLPARLGAVRVLVFEKNYAAAETELGAVLTLAPDLLPALYLQALVAYEQGDLSAAQQKLRQVLAGQSNYAPALYLMGAVQFQEKEYVQAESNLAGYTVRHPEDASGRKLLGAVRMQTGNYEGVVAALEGVAANSDDAQALAMLGTAYARLNRLNEASEILDRAVALAPDVGALRNQLAVTLLAAGDSVQAIGQLQSAIELDGELQLSDYLLVLAQLREGNVDEALAAAKLLQERAPADPMGDNLLGAVRFAEGNAAAARAAFNSALGKNPAFQPAALNLVRLELAEGNRDAARLALRALLEADADNESALLQLAELELDQIRQPPDVLASVAPLAENSERTEAIKRAEALLRRAAVAHGDSLAPRLALGRLGLFFGDAELAETESREALAIAPDNPGVLAMRIEALLLAGKRSETAQPLQLLTQLLRRTKPAKPDQTLTLARLLERAGEPAKARSVYEELSSLPPVEQSGKENRIRDAANLALLRFDLQDGKVARARERLEQVSKAGRTSVRYRLLLADVLRAEGDTESARLGYEALLAANEREALFRLSALHTSQGDAEMARNVLSRWVAGHPEDSAAEIALATSALSIGDYTEAQARFEQVLLQTPDNVVVLNNLAWLYQQTADPRAREMAQRAWSLAPTNAEVGDTYGWIIVSAGQVERGRDVLLKAQRLAPQNPSIAFHTASALAATGRTEQARAILQDVGELRLANSPDATAAITLLRELLAEDQVDAGTDQANDAEGLVRKRSAER